MLVKVARMMPHRLRRGCVLSSLRLSGEENMSYNIDLSGRVALITGASSGLGEQFAKTLAASGAAVVLAGRRLDRLKTLRAEIEGGGGVGVSTGG